MKFLSKHLSKTWRKYYTDPITGEHKFVFMVGKKTFLEHIISLDKHK